VGSWRVTDDGGSVLDIPQRPSPQVNQAFGKLQILSSAFMATSHGTNDAKKTMGIITLALFVRNT